MVLDNLNFMFLGFLECYFFCILISIWKLRKGLEYKVVEVFDFCVVDC